MAFLFLQAILKKFIKMFFQAGTSFSMSKTAWREYAATL
jgi:hypothetical protein